MKEEEIFFTEKMFYLNMETGKLLNLRVSILLVIPLLGNQTATSAVIFASLPKPKCTAGRCTSAPPYTQ